MSGPPGDAWVKEDPIPCPTCGREACEDHHVLAELLTTMAAFIRQYMVLTTDQATLATVWTAMTHAIEAFDYTAYLHITSPQPECGKSRLLEVLDALVAKPWMTGRVTAAALMRKLDQEAPTLLLDESDAAFNGDEEYSEALRALLNLGFHRRGKASVCVGQGANLAVKDFKVFAPKAIAGIDRLPSTVESRSIPIALKRRISSEQIAKWRDRDERARATALREQLAAVMVTQVDALKQARPSMPNGLSDRTEDVLEPLLAIADLAGAPWPDAVRKASVALMGSAARAAKAAEQDFALELLTDLQPIIEADDSKQDCIATKVMVEGLRALEDRPWSAFGKSEKPITGHALARLLKRFEIQPAGVVQIGDDQVRGYRKEPLIDACRRYLGDQSV
jgi:hypothetical protein